MRMAETLRTLIRAWKPPAYQSVELQDVQRFYGRHVVLHGLNLRFTAGTSTALMGPNGAGKSTVLRILSTLLPATAGTVLAGDQLKYNEHRQILRPTIGLVAHEPMLYEDLTARENLQLWADLYALDDPKIQDWLHAVSLHQVQHQLVGGFSRGMKQRLAVARALLHEPTLVLFDEVLTGLDYASRKTLWDLLRALREAQRIVVLATHIFDHPVDAVCRGVVLRHGRVVLDASTETPLIDLYTQGTSRGGRQEA